MAGTDRIPLNVLFGVPDYGPGRVRVTSDGRRLLLPVDGNVAEGTLRYTGRPLHAGERQRIGLPGVTNFVPFLSSERFALRSFYLQSGVELRMSIGPGAILNQIADPDACSGSLKLAARIVGKTLKPCFNRPAAVERTSRDGIARMLTGIGGLDVPKTIRVEPSTPSRLRDIIKESGLEYPVLVRELGTHRGISLSKVDAPGDLENTRPERGLYVSEFRDFKGADGYYRKLRIAMVGDDIFLRHCIIGEHWLLHGHNRAPGTQQKEREIFELFDREWKSRLQPVFREISARIDLDYFGMDCSIDDDGQVLLFEANAAMSIIKSMGRGRSSSTMQATIARITEAIEQRLVSLSQQAAG